MKTFLLGIILLISTSSNAEVTEATKANAKEVSTQINSFGQAFSSDSPNKALIYVSSDTDPAFMFLGEVDVTVTSSSNSIEIDYNEITSLKNFTGSDFTSTALSAIVVSCQGDKASISVGVSNKLVVQTAKAPVRVLCKGNSKKVLFATFSK